MDTIYVIGIVVFAVIGTLIAILHYSKQGKISKEIIDVVEDKVDDAIEIARDFLQIIYLGDNIEKNINTVLKITSDAVHYVADTLDPTADKKQVSIDVVNAILSELKIEATDDHKKLIKLVIDNSVRQIEKNQK